MCKLCRERQMSFLKFNFMTSHEREEEIHLPIILNCRGRSFPVL